MNEFIAGLPKHFIAALKSLKRHMAMTISSVSAVMVTLLLMAIFFVVAGNISNFTQNVEQDLKIHASIDSLVDEKQIAVMQDGIEHLKGVSGVTFSSKTEELKTLIEDSGNVFARYKDKNPMPNVFIVEVKSAQDIPDVTKKLNATEGIEKAEYGGEAIQDMIKTFDAIRVGGGAFIVALSLIAVFLITNTIKMTIYTRNTEISIMRNVGATNWYIKTPFMIEGMFIGILGSIIPMLLTIFGYMTLYHMMDGQFMSSMFVLEPVFPFAITLALMLLLCGVIVGILGSFLAATRYLRWRR